MRYLLMVLVSIMSTGVFSQNFSGSATYKTASKIPFKMDSPEMTPERKKMMEERMAQAMQKEFELIFNRNESIYKEVVELEKEGQGGMRWMSMMAGGGGTLYKNLSTSTYLDKIEFFGKQFLITDTLEKLNWKLQKETKAIGKYQCNLATTQRVVTLTRSETLNDESRDTTYQDTIDITAWYTMQVPVSNGPAQYGGLPGLIMELNDGQTTMLCTRVSIKPGEEVEINKPEGGEEVSQEEYKKITREKIEEMRRMYRRPGGRGSSSMEIRIGN
jgi:GLPGLI family protein